MKLRSLAALAAIAGMLTAMALPARADSLNGAGATFPQLLYQKWFQVYHDKFNVDINYQGIGSGGGIKAITAKTVDFGASDAPMNDTELAAAPGIVHIPTVAGAAVIAYNIPGVGPGIHLTGDVIADIFLGKITKWDDPRITSESPGTKFPSIPIATFHRSDGSGTTNIFTTYLSEVSPAWQSTVGAGKAVNWPVGDGGKGNQGVAAYIQQNEGGIGYIELAYAVQNNISYAAVQNARGKFIYPSVKSTTDAAAGSILPADFRKVITNTSAKNGYPITGFTFLLVYQTGTNPELKQFLRWALTDGQSYAAPLYYAPLPKNVQKRALKVVDSLR
ncbi:MAG: phosphate ABC transporter substrate-binding protein PstS [Capsulimonadaceae bacterium]